MALERVVIQNFQSIKKLDLELGKLTVLVGPSSSGKSAFLRAIKALASNVRGSSTITTGAKSLSISAHTEDKIITFQKTASTGKYLLTDKSTGVEDKFTTLNQKVPDQITEALNIQPVTVKEVSINFAGQFDKPYLLGESAAHVAKVLGDLTNVSTIFEAVRAANKKKLATNSLLKTRQMDLEDLLQQAQQFTDLAARRKSLEAAERALEEAEALEARQRRLAQVVASMEVSEGVIQSFTALPEVPSLEELLTLHSRYTRYKEFLKSWAKAYKEINVAELALSQARAEEKLAVEELEDYLHELGICPTCNQPVGDQR